MDAPERPSTVAEVTAWALDPSARADFSPLGPRTFLLLDGDEPVPGAGRALSQFLRALPCPSIALTTRDTPLAQSCDVVVEDPKRLPSILATIRRCPQAASVLVQLLRLIEMLPPEDALAAESLAYATLQAGPEFRRWMAAHASEPAPPREDGPAVVATRDGDALALELNRPGNRNAMSVEMRDALVEALQLVEADASIARVRISGRGKCFSTGGDLSEFGTAPDPATAHAVRLLSVPGRWLARCAEKTEVRVHGACVGSGIEFPAFAGRIVASRCSWFHLPEIGMGLIPGAGGCVSLSRRMGRQRLAAFALSGVRLKADAALAWRIVDAIED
ncbi:MAG TPA: enoyl-CoA hydratase/isomerase family protein [Nevskiaceae bacterium]|nr:enoyl-CoA hydratase/isomerase family protein [Nevskiaceae bacterium]